MNVADGPPLAQLKKFMAERFQRESQVVGRVMVEEKFQSGPASALTSAAVID